MLTGPDTWAHFKVKQVFGENYQWNKINIFTRWFPSTKQTIVIVFDAPPLLIRERIPHLMFSPDSSHLSDPFWVYKDILQEAVRLQDIAVWSLRTRVRDLEKKRERREEIRKPTGRPQPNYTQLHGLARHATHVSEMLDVATQVAGQVVAQHSSLMIDSPAGTAVLQGIHCRLQFFEGLISSLRHRSASNKDRLLNEIQLAFHTVAQYDAGTSVKIGRAAQSDSAAMKTIAFATLIFLPPTFICAIFSMSFFESTNSGDWIVSDKFWLYWAVAVPTTILTTALWHFWHKHYLLKPERVEDLKSVSEMS